MRIAARIDENQPAIVDELREYQDVTVHSTAQLGKGFPDIIVGYNGRNYLFEIKNPEKPPSKRKLTPDEDRWHRDWMGQVHTIETVSDCLQVMRLG